MHEDRHGLPLGTRCAAAAAAYREGADRLLAFWPGAHERLLEAIRADDGFALAHAALARIHLSYGRATEAREAAARARARAAGASSRERRHVEAIGRIVDGTSAQALALVLEHARECPRDAMVLSLALGAFGLLAFSGRADHDAARLALLESVAPHYGEDWWFLTQLGWARTEACDARSGRELTERGLALKPDNAHGAHALAHACHEMGDTDGGVGFLEDWLPRYPRDGALHGHLHWHIALLELADDRDERALQLYRERFAPGACVAPPINVVTDGAGLLWRLRMAGAPGLEEPWRETADCVRRTCPDAGAHFVDLHAAMAAAATGDDAALEARIAQLERRLAEGRLAPGAVALAACRAFGAIAHGRNDDAVALLQPLAAEFARVGGSHAQREVLEETLIVACLRSGRGVEALPLIERRLATRPSRRDARYRAQALRS